MSSDDCILQKMYIVMGHTKGLSLKLNTNKHILLNNINKVSKKLWTIVEVLYLQIYNLL